MSEDNVSFVRGLYEAFAKGDVDTVLAGFSDDIEWIEPESSPYGGQHHGPQDVAENVFGPVTSDFEDFDVTPEQILADGDLVVVLLTQTGTAKETGNVLKMPAAHVWKIADGKATHFQLLGDTSMMSKALAAEAAA